MFLPYDTPVFPPDLHCYHFLPAPPPPFFHFFVSTILLRSTVPQVSLSSSTFTFSQSFDFPVSDVQELKRKGQTWMVLFDLFWSHHWSKGPPSCRYFTFSFCCWCFPLSACDKSLGWKVFENTAICWWWCIITPYSQKENVFNIFSHSPFLLRFISFPYLQHLRILVRLSFLI